LQSSDLWLCLFAATKQHNQELGHLQMEAIYAIFSVESTRACFGNTASKELYAALSDLVLGAASTCLPVSTLQHCAACMGVIADCRNFAKRQVRGQALPSWVLLKRMATLLEVIVCTYLSSLCPCACIHQRCCKQSQQSAGSVICRQPCLSLSDVYIPIERPSSCTNSHVECPLSPLCRTVKTKQAV